MAKPSAKRPSKRQKNLLPQSLLWQAFLLIAVILILALVASSQIFAHFQEPTRARDLSQMVTSVVNVVRTALINAQVSQRPDLLIDLAAGEGIRIYPSEPGDDILPLPKDRPNQLLSAEIKHQLGAHTRLASQWKTLEGFWVSFKLQPGSTDEFWIMMPPERFHPTRNADWPFWISVALVVALVGAFLIVILISKPLRRLAQAVRLVSDGKPPPKLEEDGPLEVATVARAFNQMTGDLSQADQERALLLAGVSHDLRTPLARLRLSIEMSGAQESDINAMVRDIEEMDRVIGQFLDFGRGHTQELPQRKELVQLIRDAIEPFRLRGVNIKLSAPKELWLPLRPLLFQRLLSNLLNNALRYAGSHQPIALRIHTRQDTAVLEVLDQGPGIPESEIARLLRPFTRLEQARSNTTGAGLGLAIVERIMRSHNGTVSLRNRTPNGLCVTLRFPLDEDTLEPLSSKALKNGEDHA